jgi:putative methyltransferase (TIGR04325 family)
LQDMKHFLRRITPAYWCWKKVKLWRYRKFFYRTGFSNFYGVFNSFEEALKHIPEKHVSSYDHYKLVDFHRSKLGEMILEANDLSIPSFEYPVFFWLMQILLNGRSRGDYRIFDYGGSVGTHFFRLNKLLMTNNIGTYEVFDLPGMVLAGEELRRKYKDYDENLNKLIFTSNLERMNSSDIVLASGSLQYAADFDFNISKKPIHIIVNRVPVCGREFVTLQNTLNVYFPVRIFILPKLLSYFRSLGYEIRDCWDDDFDNGRIPFYPEDLTISYKGFYCKYLDYEKNNVHNA